MTVKAKTITRLARSYIGVPYRHQGRTRKALDCWGLLFAVATDAGILPDSLNVPADYGPMSNVELRAGVARYCTPTKAPGDGVLALIRWPGTNYAGHLGLLTVDGTIIHAYSMEAKVVEMGFRGAWVRMCDSLWHLPGVEYP